MKFFAISDLHISTTADKPMDIFGAGWENYLEKIIADWKEKVSEDDVVFIAGDLSWAMQLDNAVKDLSLFAPLPGKKIVIRGNHDYWWKSLSRVREALPEFIVLQNDAVKIGNVVVCGSRGWTVEGANDFTEQDRKLYLREGERLLLALKAAEKLREDGDRLVVMIHYPPFNVKRENSIYTDLFEKYGVNAVIYGHLHGKDCRGDLYRNKNGIDYYLTSCDKLGNKLAEIPIIK